MVLGLYKGILFLSHVYSFLFVFFPSLEYCSHVAINNTMANFTTIENCVLIHTLLYDAIHRNR
uniref:Uncharacterized protein n=1 Tax=Leersia perrieri TaxID=77586 RepID=A0A0D9VW52_9ORYZ